MLITPRPGADREIVRQVLRRARQSAGAVWDTSPQSAHERLLQYLEWATGAARILGAQVRDEDVDRLVLTRRYHALLAYCGTLASSSQERLVNGLVNLELEDRLRAFAHAEEDLDALIARWGVGEHYVIADSSFYIHNPDKLEDADLVQAAGLPWSVPLRLLFPMTVVDELDNLKESGKNRARWRASYTLGLLDRVLQGSTFGALSGTVQVEIVLDPPGHVRLPIADDEIIDRAVAINALAGNEVRLLTCDTGQHTRGRAAGLKVTKIPAKDPGPEPDWSAEERPGTGTRARRREQQVAREG